MKLGASQTITFNASQDAQLRIRDHQSQLMASATGKSLSFIFSPTSPGSYSFFGAAERNGVVARDTLFITVAETLFEALPSGAKRGINYLSGTEVLLVLEAPGKEFAHVIGDFNNWEIDPAFQMKQTPDREFFWFRLNDLEPGKEYIFQYLVDGDIRIADPYSAKISRGGTFGDAEIIAQGRYPGLLPYPTGKTDFEASYLQTLQEEYTWKYNDYERPAVEDLVIYELLVRDFTEERTYAAVRQRLDYLEALGINALQLMPIMEFEGNISWGYNPAFFFAADKFYGPTEELKKLIDEAHGRGMVVILDMVLNHAFGQNPMVRLFNEGDYGRPLAENPWFNVEPKHPFNVGYDFNHESKYTQFLVDTVNHYWLNEFKFDGYRFDLSKGFTQRNSGTDVAGWSAYDASRITLLKRMYDAIRSYDQDAYLILEHFADNTEEKELADYGFLLWGNMNGAGRAQSKGDAASFSNAWHRNRNWNDPHLVAYLESHDEERLMYEALTFGRSGGGINLRNLTDAVDRMQMLTALFMSIPGPKMIWQFGEFGYDLELNNDRLGIKPTRWEYLNHADRRRLFELHAWLFGQKTAHPLFKPDEVSLDVGGTIKRVHLRKANQHLLVVGNTGLGEQNVQINFPVSGKWYDILAQQELFIPEQSKTVSLKPNSFYILSTSEMEVKVADISRTEPFPATVTSLEKHEGSLRFFPNPASDVLRIVLPDDLQVEQVQLTNMHGQMLNMNTTNDHAGQLSINVGHLPQGLYVIRLMAGNAIYTGKIIKR
jgi:1,4-alpha-glucan branching enzyme